MSIKSESKWKFMKVRNLIVGMLFLFILAGASGLVEATRQQRYNFPPGEKEGASTAPAIAKSIMLMNRIGPSKSELYVANEIGRAHV